MISIIIIILIICLIFLIKIKDKPESTDSTPINKSVTYKGLKFTNFDLETDDIQSNLIVKVTNTTNKTINIKKIKIELLDDKNKKIVTLVASIGEDLSSGETRKISTSVGFNLKKAAFKKILEY